MEYLGGGLGKIDLASAAGFSENALFKRFNILVGNGMERVGWLRRSEGAGCVLKPALGKESFVVMALGRVAFKPRPLGSSKLRVKEGGYRLVTFAALRAVEGEEMR